MDVGAIPSAGINALMKAQGEYATRVLRKALDVSSSEAAQLAQMIGQGAGLGRSMDVSA